MFNNNERNINERLAQLERRLEGRDREIEDRLLQRILVLEGQVHDLSVRAAVAESQEEPNPAEATHEEEIQALRDNLDIIEHNQDEFRLVLRQLANAQETIPIGSLISYGGGTRPEDLGSIAQAGFAICNGQTPTEQGIEDAVLTGNTPNLTGGQYLKGMSPDDASYGMHLEANTLVFSSTPGNNYTHADVIVPTNGTTAGNAGDARPFIGKWEQEGTRLGIRWLRGDPEPKNYGIFYIMRVK